jgi:hypothetical protein
VQDYALLQALSNMAWASAKVDFYHEGLFDTMAARVCTGWGQLCPVRYFGPLPP